MKKGFREYVFVINKSEAFANVQEEVIAGFNAIVDAQKSSDKETAFTLAFFSNEPRISANGKPMSLMRKYNSKTYAPKGGSALYDALGEVIDLVGERLDAAEEAERPEKVSVFVISSADDASTVFTREALYDKVGCQRFTYKWDFRFYGTGGEDINIADGMFLSKITKKDIAKAFEAINKVITAER
ncbi:MAG: hypothetical protein Q4C12_02500 [Clostridia bacterium]|nr:hypothetical protein [Clostridia bacterium]